MASTTYTFAQVPQRLWWQADAVKTRGQDVSSKQRRHVWFSASGSGSTGSAAGACGFCAGAAAGSCRRTQPFTAVTRGRHAAVAGS